MKRILLLLALSFVFSCAAIEQNNAIEYNNSLVDIQELAADNVNEFIDLMLYQADSLDYNLVHTTRKNVLEELDSHIKKVEEIGGFEKSNEFQLSILQVLHAYRNGIANEYSTMANFLLLPEEEKSEERFTETENTAYIADSLIEISEQNFIQAQEVFAALYQLQLEEI